MAALVGAAALILWLDRGTTYNVDQIRFFLASPTYDLHGLLEPQNGNLLLTTTLTYKILLGAFGTGFLPFRIIHLVPLAASATLLYVLMRRRVGPPTALAASLVLLVFGSDWGHIATPLGFTVLASITGGLASLLLLERDDQIGDAGSCAALIFSVASFSVGLAFLAGVAVSVLLRPDRWRRAWIFLIPLALYAVWFVWAHGSGASAPSHQGHLSNLLLQPGWAFDSLSAVLASLTGLDYPFDRPGRSRHYHSGSRPGTGGRRDPGPRLVPGSAWRPRADPSVGRDNHPPHLLGARRYHLERSSGSGEDPLHVSRRRDGPSSRDRGFQRQASFPSRTACPVRRHRASVATNLALLRDGAAWFRNEYSAPTRALFTSLDLASGRVNPHFIPPPR